MNTRKAQRQLFFGFDEAAHTHHPFDMETFTLKAPLTHCNHFRILRYFQSMTGRSPSPGLHHGSPNFPSAFFPHRGCVQASAFGVAIRGVQLLARGETYKRLNSLFLSLFVRLDHSSRAPTAVRHAATMGGLQTSPWPCALLGRPVKQ